MLSEGLLNRLVEPRDVLAKDFQLIQQDVQVQDRHTDPRVIGGQCLGLGNQGQALFDQVLRTDLMLVVEAFEGSRSGRFETDQVRPTIQEGQCHVTFEIACHLQSLWIIAFEQTLDLQNDLRAPIYQLMSSLNQAGQFDRDGVLRFQWAQLGVG